MPPDYFPSKINLFNRMNLCSISSHQKKRSNKDETNGSTGAAVFFRLMRLAIGKLER